MKKIYVAVAAWGLLCFTACQPRLYPQRIQPNYLQITATQAEDSMVVKEIKPYKEQIEKRMNMVIGIAEKELRANRNDIESTLGNFVADLIHSQTEKHLQQAVDFAIVNNGSLRVSINAGNITLGNIYELMPFENELLIIRLKGKDLLELLAYEGQFRKTSFSRMQIRYTADGQLVQALLNGQKIDLDKDYVLAAYDYLGNGGDGMTFLKPLKKEVLGITLRSAIIAHIEDLHKNGKKADANIERRVLFD